jgi:hypothetical protein
MSINDYFIGKETTALNGDKFAIQFIDSEMVKEDILYQETKWWDYRMLHPTALTCLFAQVFYKVCGDVAERELGEFDAKRYRDKAKNFDVRTQSVAIIRAFWKARMNADAMGVPYEIYLRGAVENFRANFHIIKTTKSGKQHFPYPQQLVSEFINVAVLKEWDSHKSVFFPFPENKNILNNNQLWFRKDMEKWLASEIRKSDLPKRRFRECVERGVIILPAVSSV